MCVCDTLSEGLISRYITAFELKALLSSIWQRLCLMESSDRKLGSGAQVDYLIVVKKLQYPERGLRHQKG